MMAEQPHKESELERLLIRVVEGEATAEDGRALEAILRADADARRFYAQYLALHAALQTKQTRSPVLIPSAIMQAHRDSQQADPGAVAPPPLPPPTTAPVLGFLGGLMGPLGGSPVLRLVLWAAGLFGAGLGVVLLVLALSDRSVARLTAGVNCRWQDSTKAPDKSGRFSRGQTLELTAGVAEITFHRGARVVLEAPATFRVETDNSGYLTSGKLVAKVPKEALGFAVDTAWANVVDLGTEFAVEAAAGGRGQAHVLSGKVVLEPLPVASGTQPDGVAAVELHQGEAVSVTADHQVERMAAQPERFLSELPEVFAFHNTGEEAGPGQADPHWELAATSTDASFQPRAAEVVRLDTPVGKLYPSWPSDASRWISVSADHPDVAARSTWTFRTRFNLDGFDPATARLEGEFAADDQVKEVWLNGKLVARFPPLGFGTTPLRIDQGFVAGENILEYVVFNKARRNGGPSPIALRVELQGRARRK